MQDTLTPLQCNDVYLIADNLDMALNVFRRRRDDTPQPAFDIYLQSVLTSLRRDLLRQAYRLQNAECAGAAR